MDKKKPSTKIPKTKIDVTKTILRNDNPINVASIIKPRLPINKPRLPRLPITKPTRQPLYPITNPKPIKPITKPLPITNPYKKAPTITNPIRPPTPLPIKPITKPTLPRKYIRPSAGPKIETPWNVPKPLPKKYPPREGQRYGKWIYKNGEWVERIRWLF